MTESEQDPRQRPASEGVVPASERKGGLLARFEASAARLAAEESGDRLPDRLCQAIVEVTAIPGSAISVYLGGDVAIPVGASDLASTAGEALQFTVREGPCFSAYSSGRAVLVPDLDQRGSQAWSDWPTYAEQLIRHTPYRAVFAFPLFKGGLPLGSVSLYSTAAGIPDFLGEFTDIAACVTDRLFRAEPEADPGSAAEPRWLNGPVAVRRRQVWLAQGLTIQANRITPAQALELLRAQAFSADRLLDDVAEDIVAGRLPVPALESHQ